MKTNIRRKLARATAVLAILGSAGAWGMSTFRDWREIDRMTEKTKTICVGRLLIDLPQEAKVEIRSVSIDNIAIAAFEESHEEFQQRLAHREQQIRSIPGRLVGLMNLESAKDINTDNGMAGRIFVHGRTVTEGTRGSRLNEEHYRYEGVATEGLVHHNEVSIDLAVDDYDPALVGNLPRLVSQLVANRDNHIPSDPGFCFDRAYVRDPLTADQHERVSMFVSFPSHPDVAFKLRSVTGLEPYRYGLLARADEVRARMSWAEKLRFTNLRAAERRLGSLVGEESIERVVEDDSVVVHGFQWETQGRKESIQTPKLVIEMRTSRIGNKNVPSSLSQGAAMGLWDAILSSIRIRPTAPAGTGQ